jgi:hypothetical protein
LAPTAELLPKAALKTEGLPTKEPAFDRFLAALAAVLIAVCNIAVAKSEDYYKRADEIRDLIAREVLDNLGASDRAMRQHAIGREGERGRGEAAPVGPP